jgi:outer membrane lipoprotein-sorting protein
MDKADRVLDTKIFEGRECVGFEIDASQYDDNPKGRTDRIWFDVKTKLPVRIEKHGQPLPYGLRGTTIQDRFEYYAKVDAEMFKPRIPDDFINAEPDEIRAAREKKEKGQMLYADVPSGLGAEIAAALKEVKTAVFWEGYGATLSSGTKVSSSERQWRRDTYSNGAPRRTEWFTVSRGDQGSTAFDFNDRSFQLTQTIVDFKGKWYKIVKYGRESHPDHPMDNIIFLTSWFDKADRFWESERIDGIECFGFELSAKKYGSNPDTSKHRIWFDAKTKLPVKMESEWLQDDGPRKRTTGRFQWNAEIPTGTFEPMIPEGFMNAHPDEIQAAGER